MSKFLYPIYKLKTKSYIKWWLYHKKAGGSGILSEILQGFSFNLENTLNRKFNLFEIQGNSVQDGTPSPDNEVPILSTGDNGSINEKIQNKNLFDIEKAVKRFENWVGDLRSDWGTYENGVVNIVKSNGADGYYGFAGQKFAFNKGASCTLSAEVLLEGTNSVSNVKIGVEERKKDNTPIGSVKNINIDKNKWTHITLIVSFTEAVTNARVQIEASNTGNTVQIKNIQLEQGSTATQYVPHEEQDYSIFVQQPMRSIGDVRDCFVKKSDGKLYERHLPYIASYNGETLPQDVYNEVDNVKYCNEKSMSTTGQFSIGASVQYIDENNWNDLPCTEEQIQQIENKPSTYKDFTIIQSEDETPAYLKIQYYKEG